MYIGALKFSHSYFNVYVARVAPLGFFYTCLRSAPTLLDTCRIDKFIWRKQSANILAAVFNLCLTHLGKELYKKATQKYRSIRHSTKIVLNIMHSVKIHQKLYSNILGRVFNIHIHLNDLTYI